MLFITIQAPQEPEEHIEVYYLCSNGNPFGDEIYITINVENHQEEPVFDSAVLTMIPKDSIKMKPKEVKKLNVQLKNTGNVSWPVTTALYQGLIQKEPAFVDGKKSMIVGDCNAQAIKQIEL